jgi:hypothetical protein
MGQCCLPFSVSQAFGHSQINTGCWVVGFGTEGKLLVPGWTYKIESLYMDLGTLDTGIASGVTPKSCAISVKNRRYADYRPVLLSSNTPKACPL